MNNGNLLNTLMGATGANAVAAKTTAAKTRAETGEKFQQAFEQARPEVAARKPVARKEAAPIERSDAARPVSKAANQHPSQQETNRTEGTKKPSVADRKVADNTGKSESPARDVKADKPADTTQDDTQAASATQCGEPKAPTEVLAENLLLVDPAVDSELSKFPVSSGVLPELSVDALLTSHIEDEGISDLEGDDSLLLQDASLLAGILPAVSSDLTEGENTGLSPLVASAQAGLGQMTGALSATSQSIEAQVSAAQLISGGLPGKGPDGLSAAIDGTNGESETSVESNAGENPDFLLLNSKAALNKLAEANIAATTLDNSAPAADLAKPAAASAASAAIETLTRLTEAQSPAARAFVVQTGVPVTVGTPQWSQAVGDKVLWFAAQNVSSAEIRLDPPELGPMQVKVSVNQDQASITFTSPHPVVREALDQQLNRLREMFSEQGLNLVNVDVSDKSFAQQEREQDEANKGQANSGMDDEEAEPAAMIQAISMRLVDHYA